MIHTFLLHMGLIFKKHIYRDYYFYTCHVKYISFIFPARLKIPWPENNFSHVSLFSSASGKPAWLNSSLQGRCVHWKMLTFMFHRNTDSTVNSGGTIINCNVFCKCLVKLTTGTCRNEGCSWNISAIHLPPLRAVGSGDSVCCRYTCSCCRLASVTSITSEKWKEKEKFCHSFNW